MKTVWSKSWALTIVALAACGGGLGAFPQLPPPKVATTPPVGQMPVAAGETQSTVVGPSLKTQCPAGRLLITNDNQRPPGAGTVTGRNLDDLYGVDVASSFDAAPGTAAEISWQTNDHDISVLANGDVVLTFSVHLATALDPKPPWFDQTFKGTFGPGVRRGLMTWRSIDCGETFQYQSTVDPIDLGTDGECANPQPVKDAEMVDGAYPPPFANGGVDGNLVKADLLDDKLYLVFQCVGNLPDTSKADYQLSPKGVNKTFILRSDDEGTTWTTLGNLDVADWRIGVAALDATTLGFAQGSQLLFGHNAGPAWAFDGTGPSAPNGSYGWDGWDEEASPFDEINANLWSSMLTFKDIGGGTGIYLVFPDTIDNGEGVLSHGARLFYYSRTADDWAEARSILPMLGGLDQVILHPTIIEVKGGPTLIYWYDIDGPNGSVRMRGRFVYATMNLTGDFDIALNAAVGADPPAPHTFAFGTPGASYWYGDYHTGGAHAVDSQTWDYYPIWVEPDSTVRFSKVSATFAGTNNPFFHTAVAPPFKPVIKKAGRRTRPTPTGRHIPEGDERD